MFAKTRIRLTLLNAAVFFVILACIGFVVYIELRHQLYDKVDASIMARVGDFQTPESKKGLIWYEQKTLPPLPAGDDMSKKKVQFQVREIDPRIFMVFWDEQGTPWPSTPIDAANKQLLSGFSEYRSEKSPATVKIGGHAYRIYSVAVDQPLNLQIVSNTNNVFMGSINSKAGAVQMLLDNGTPIRVRAVQGVANVDSEQNMLNTLLQLILFGIVAGGAVTVLAGLYLANQALLPIRRSWEKQRQFAADASHELRMPLSIIQANAELMLRHPERSALELSEPISMVLAESKRMAKLTDQLLTLARSDSDQEELLLQPIVLDQLLEEVVRKFAPLAELKSIQLCTGLLPAVEIMGDREKLQQLFVILLDNSMKYTPEKGTIRVMSRKNGHYAAIVVEDTGSGIAANDLPHIFDRFYRGDKARGRSEGGTGLGLAIAKWIAEKHGGSIAAASKLGEGTSITVQLPIIRRRQ
ncbi:hypothetical protein SD70_15885 [Gordoniibacillus kamchatkensis]|uniref:histidine kinase n=1 Tax=Gordoniibacillus kamchatkensis TaxID=1590651 RepID=A0ABR5AGX1_9BACL|nr:HAMP domain-containing sensor histidine kinase [Paenibacillus sp. VKM B-2647]KIL40147.1 hypothetical protein SD70_15885 [Paenibacillus sp. VKM B-2647]